MNIGVVLASGKGERFGGNTPKQFALINELKMVVEYPINALLNCKLVDKVIVVTNKPYDDLISSKYTCDICYGGETRNETVSNVIEYIKEYYPSCDNVVFVDSVRPFLSNEDIEDTLQLLTTNDAVITCQDITDSLGKEEFEIIDRAPYFLIQTPEAFRFNKLINFSKNSKCTAIVQQISSSSKIYKNFRKTINLKITYPRDLKYAKLLLEGGD